MSESRPRVHPCLGCNLRFSALLLIYLLTIPLGRSQSFGTLRGVVTDQFNAVISDTLIRLYSADRVLQTKTDKNGQFEFTNERSGTYELNAFRSGFQTRKIDRVQIPENDEEKLSISLLIASQPSDCGRGSAPTYDKIAVGQPALIGVVRNDAGVPSAAFKIRLLKTGSTRVVASQSSNENGEFQFRDVEPGQYVVRASHKGKWQAQSEIFWITRENITRIVLEPVKHGTIILCQ